MKLPLSWLSDYLDMEGIDAKSYAHALTMSGSKVEGYESKGDGINKVVTGKITSMEKHPDADKLKICSVDIGSETLQIVTGAPNVREGDVIPLALVGSTLPGGVKIKKGRLRGVDSCGMMCSTDELGMTENEATGVLILDPATELGKDIKEVLKLDDSVIEFEITSNRPDCLSVIGLARETAATYARPFRVPDVKIEKEDGDIKEYIKVRVENPELCPRYTARVVKNVKIQESPDWLKARLQACGVRAINTIVDITNYVMLEYGQPMHAFDIRDLAGQEVVVKNATDGEKMNTLDGVERALTGEMLTIRDAEKAVAVAGVMGGENSEVKDDTATVVFESANFNGPSVRRTAQKLGMRTEASGRYEKGLDAQMTLDAVNRACQLCEMLGCGEVVGGVIDIDNSKKQPHTVVFRPEKINEFLGTNIPEADMIEYLSRLDVNVENGQCTVPSFRADLEGEADIAEEVARLYGYEKIPPAPMRGDTTLGEKNGRQKLSGIIMDTLTGCGFYEIMTYSFVSPQTYDKLLFPADSPLRRSVTILNPLGEETSVMRTTALGGMLETAARNLSHKVAGARFFEIGRIYLPKETAAQLPEERDVVTVGMYNAGDFYDLKGVVEAVLAAAGISKYKVAALTDHPTYHPGKTAQILVGNRAVATFGEVHPNVLKNFEIKTAVLAAEIDFEALLKFGKHEKKYQPLQKYPAVSRDIAVLVDESILVGEIEELVKKNAGALLETLTLFDVYQGKQVPEGKKSVAYSMTLRAKDHTLAEEEIRMVMGKIVDSLTEKLHAQLRDS